MITACKMYLTNNGLDSIWDQAETDADGIRAKMKACLQLHEQYKQSFQRTKELLQRQTDERQFDFSEMYIFGKFLTFSKRYVKRRTIFEGIISALSHSPSLMII